MRLMMMMIERNEQERMSPTAQTLNALRRQGFAAGIVERWIAQAGIRKDLFGCIDLIAAKPGEPIIGIQATSNSNVSARLTKARSIPELATWLATGARFQVWGWAKVNGCWHPRIVEVRPGDMKAEVVRPLPRRRRKPRHKPTDLFAALPD